MTCFRNHTVLFRSIAIFMCMVLVMHTFATGASEASKSLISIWRKLTNEMPPKFSHPPRPRPHRDNLRRDVNRDKWWTPEAREALEQAFLATEGAEELASFIVASIIPGMALAWTTGSNSGYAIPGEGSFPGGGSGRLGNQLGLTGTVNSATSNLTLSLPVVSFPTRGDLEVDLTLYHNSYSWHDGDLSPKWTHSYSMNVLWTPYYAFVEMPDGLYVPFQKSGPNYISPPGFFGKLEDTMTGRKLTMRDQTIYHFTTFGSIQRLTAIEDRSGNQITLTWSSGLLQTVVAPDFRTLTFSYNGNGDIDQIDGPDSKTWVLGYNVNDRLVTVQYPQPTGKNRVVTLDYDVNDNIIEELDPEGNSWTWSYSGDDCTGWQDPASSNPASATFSPITGGLAMQPAFGLAWEHVYSGGLLWIDQDGEGFFTEVLAYDTAVNKPTDFNDKRGMPWEFAYNAMGQVTDKWTPLGHHTNITYTALNDVDVVTGPVTGEFIDYDYNLNGLLEKVTQSVDSTPTDREVVTLDYDGNGDILWTRDALKRQTDYVVNTNGDVEEVYPPDNADKFFAYDDYGRLTDSYDNASNLTTTTYDETGWPIRVDHPDASYIEFEYDDCGRKTDFYDELFRHQIWAYDESGRMTSHTNGRGDVNSYLYNAQDLVETHTNGNSTSWDYYYTNRGELFVLMHPGHQVESWTYDGNGNTTNTRLNAAMSLDVVDYVYDDDNRQIYVDYPTDTDVSFDYDDANRRTEMIDGTGTTEWTYDLAGQVTLLETPQGDVSYTYNADGTRDTMTEVGLGTMSYAWDAATGQLTSQTNRFSETTSYDYDPSLGQMTKKTLDNGSYTEYTHDSRYRVDSVTHRKANTTLIGSEVYSWNVAGELDDKTVDGVTTTYAYDDASQLTDESRSGYVANYTYDDNGNRLTKTLNSVTETYIYGPEERLEEITGGSDPREFTYDDGGRTATIDRGSGDVTNFTYDEGSRVTQITRPGMTTNTYSYNALDTRVGMTDSLGSRDFARDGVDVTDGVLNDGTRAYTPGISQRQSGNSKFVLDDYLGTTGRLLDSSENVTDTFTYDAFGVQTARTGSTVRPFGYAGAHGYQEDGDTGFKLLGHRFYDPSTGRFLTRDPIKDGTNWYAYCENNPLSRIDPTGQEWHDPMSVYVDPDFKGKVWVVGEPGKGQGQVVVQLKPGEQSPSGMDVDYVVIVFPDGTVRKVFLPGLGYFSDGDWAEHATVGRNGDIFAPGAQIDILGNPYFEGQITNAKRRPLPKGFAPRYGKPVQAPARYWWDEHIPNLRDPKVWRW